MASLVFPWCDVRLYAETLFAAERSELWWLYESAATIMDLSLKNLKKWHSREFFSLGERS